MVIDELKLTTKAGEPLRVRRHDIIDQHGERSLWCVELKSPAHGGWIAVSEWATEADALLDLEEWLK
jgi:hypothetical protein